MNNMVCVLRASTHAPGHWLPVTGIPTGIEFKKIKHTRTVVRADIKVYILACVPALIVFRKCVVYISFRY